MRPITVTAGPFPAPVANGIAQAQTPASAGNLILNGSYVSGGIATLGPYQRRVIITSTANDSVNTFTINGLSQSGSVLTETLVGPNTASVQSNLSYKTVSSITISGASVGTITAGTNTVGSSTFVAFDAYAFPQVSIQANPNGVTATIEQTLDDPNSQTNPVATANMVWLPHPDPALNTFSTAVQGNYGYAPVYARVTVTAGTGTVTATFIQAAAVPK